MELKHIGSFEVNSGKLVVSDPCYSPPECTLENVRNGTYHAHLNISDEGNWGKRVAELVAKHSSLSGPNGGSNITSIRSIDGLGVDSGQMSIVDSNCYHGDNSKWCDKICELTLEKTHYTGGVFEGGVVSSSGFGDGVYNSSILCSDGEIVGISVVFIYEDEE